MLGKKHRRIWSAIVIISTHSDDHVLHDVAIKVAIKRSGGNAEFIACIEMTDKSTLSGGDLLLRLHADVELRRHGDGQEGEGVGQQECGEREAGDQDSSFEC